MLDFIGAADFSPAENFFLPSSEPSWIDANLPEEPGKLDYIRDTVTDVEFLGEESLETGFSFENTEVGGLSGLTYDPDNRVYYALSDDRSQVDDARFYTISIDLSDGSLDEGDIELQDVTTLRNENGEPFAEGSIDPEGIALTEDNTLLISSEGNAENLISPSVKEFSLEGQQIDEFPVPNKFLPTEDGDSGIRNNLALESLSVTPDGTSAFTATENALIQDGPSASLDQGSPSRILQYSLSNEEPTEEFLYLTDPIPAAPQPASGFADNGLVDLLALDNSGTLLALERSFASGVGNNIRLYEVSLQGATDISDSEDKGLEVDEAAQKRLLLNFSELGIELDNSEALAFGPKLPNGEQALIVASDNNFNESQSTQFLSFSLETRSSAVKRP